MHAHETVIAHSSAQEDGENTSPFPSTVVISCFLFTPLASLDARVPFSKVFVLSATHPDRCTFTPNAVCTEAKANLMLIKFKVLRTRNLVLCKWHVAFWVRRELFPCLHWTAGDVCERIPQRWKGKKVQPNKAENVLCRQKVQSRMENKSKNLSARFMHRKRHGKKWQCRN